MPLEGADSGTMQGGPRSAPTPLPSGATKHGCLTPGSQPCPSPAPRLNSQPVVGATPCSQALPLGGAEQELGLNVAAAEWRTHLGSPAGPSRWAL